MVSKLALVSNILLASLALASPFSRHGAHLARRRENRQPQPDNLIESPAGNISKRDNYSHNWAGALWTAGSKHQGTFTSVQGTFTALIPPHGNSGTVGIWVGIDGSTCPSALFQTGVILYAYTDGVVTYTAFWEWYPDNASGFSDPLIISSGDVIRAMVTVDSPTSGTATIQNLTTKKNVTEHVTSSHALCQQEASWIAEDPVGNDNNLVAFLNFGTMTFTNAAASGIGGDQHTPINGATTVNIKQGGKVLTSVNTDHNTGNLYIRRL